MSLKSIVLKPFSKFLVWMSLKSIVLKPFLLFSDAFTRNQVLEANTITIDWTSDDEGDYDELNPVFKRQMIRNSGFGDDGFSVEITKIQNIEAGSSKPKRSRVK